MGTVRLLSWNVNGIRAVHKKNFMEWLHNDQPDILCLQETKAQDDQIPKDISEAEGYEFYHAAAERKGYSGVAMLTKFMPVSVNSGMGIAELDSEGRLLQADFGKFILLNIYFPNGKQSKERLQYKMDFYDAFLDYADRLRAEGKKIIICGDVNTAHKEIDLAHPKENEKRSGFLPEERAWIDRLLAHGFVDTFRMFVKEGGHYSWWDMRTRARDRDIGWRIDYFFVSEDLTGDVKNAFIEKEVLGSDHCPVGIELDASLLK
ncbi:exodeoxyribonuclease III [candidate division KSB1 bacterium 4484_87]|nr:MAG: exodeoxyribonuclease III [candidate division KSB1 bacterium 4484_87]